MIEDDEEKGKCESKPKKNGRTIIYEMDYKRPAVLESIKNLF